MRLFIASPLTNEVEEMLGKAIFVLKQKRTRVNWVAPKNIHLTLKFLGDTDEAQVAEIISSLESIAGRHRAVNSMIDRLGAFPNIRRPRVIWAGLSGGIEQLEALAGEIEEAMAAFGFPKENRPFKSHLTLGRVKDNFQTAELAEAVNSYQFVPEKIVFSEMVLFKSTLTPRGPIYERLSTWKLMVSNRE
nr:RNA 2',3'-cyclic phosphodiesterase [candidate division Zixibacteria bacterium]